MATQTAAAEHEQMPIQEIGPDSYRVAYEGDPLAPVCEDQTEEEARRSDEVAEHRTEGYGKVAFFLMLNVGLILTAVAMVLFKTPNHLAFGGTTGVAIVLGALFPQLPVSSFMGAQRGAGHPGLCVPRTQGHDLELVCLHRALRVRLALRVDLPGDAVHHGRPHPGRLLCRVLLPALGSALVFDIGASTGGTDILAMILRKRTDVEIGKALFAVDIAIVCAAAVIYGRAPACGASWA